MELILRIALTPELMVMCLTLCVSALITTIASAVIGLSVSIVVLLGVVDFCIGLWQNGVAFFVLAPIASPTGLPVIANFLLDRIDHAIGFFEVLTAV